MSKTIKDITATQTTLNSTDYFEIQEDAGTSKKVQWSTMVSAFPVLYVGESMQIFNSYKPITSAFPWLCMSLSDRTLSTTNYSQDFIDVLRVRKVIYDELDTAVSSFYGTWSGSNFTLNNNAANVAMIAELYDDWLYAGSPVSGWRILVSNGAEFNITGFTVASRIITVSGSPTGTSIEIYLNRILGSTTSAKHFSWSGLGLYMTGQNKITGLRRKDKMQGHYHNVYATYTDRTSQAAGNTYAAWQGSTFTLAQGGSSVQSPKTDGTNGTPRTGTKTEMESATAMLYLYVGSYTE